METLGKYFRIHIILLKIGGIQLIGEESSPYKIYSLFFRCIVYICPFLPFLDYIDEPVENRSTFTTVFYQVAFFLAIFKSMVLFLKRKKVGYILLKLEQEPFISNLKRGGVYETEAIEKFVQINNIQTKLYLTLVFLYYILIISYILIRRLTTNDPAKWPIPFFKLGFVNSSYSPNYEAVAFYQTFASMCLSLYFLIIDLIVSGVLCNISYQLKILQNNLVFITKSSYLQKVGNDSLFQIRTHDNIHNTFDNGITWREYKSVIKNAVEYHINIIDIVKDIEDIFSVLLMVVLINTLALLGSTIYLNSVIATFDVTTVRRFGEMGGSLFQVYLLCFWGERIQEESENVGRAAYDISFTFSCTKLHQALNLIILRSQRPIKITAGKFADFGLKTLLWILRTSYSTFMILRKSQQK